MVSDFFKSFLSLVLSMLCMSNRCVPSVLSVLLLFK